MATEPTEPNVKVTKSSQERVSSVTFLHGNSYNLQGDEVCRHEKNEDDNIMELRSFLQVNKLQSDEPPTVLPPKEPPPKSQISIDETMLRKLKINEDNQEIPIDSSVQLDIENSELLHSPKMKKAEGEDDASVSTSSSQSVEWRDPPPGSLFHESMLPDYKKDEIRPDSPNDVMEFHQHCEQNLETLLSQMSNTPRDMESVSVIKCHPRVVGLNSENDAVKAVNRDVYVKAIGTRKPKNALTMWLTHPSLIDGGSNINLTPYLKLLIQVVDLEQPMAISCATDDGGEPHIDDCCTKKGLLPLELENGEILYVVCYYCKNASDTIISPQAIVENSNEYNKWTQVGYSDRKRPGSITFSHTDRAIDDVEHVAQLKLKCNKGLYYCSSECIVKDTGTVRSYQPMAQADENEPMVYRIKRDSQSRTEPYRPSSRRKATNHQLQLEAEQWSLRLGSPGEEILMKMPQHAEGLPPHILPHPNRFIDFKESAAKSRQSHNRTAEHFDVPFKRLGMDFGFIRASTHDFTRPNKDEDRIVTSYDGYNTYLIISDEATRYVWVFLFKSKEPPIATIRAFLDKFGVPKSEGGYIRTDQGGELAKCQDFVDQMLKHHGYVVEQTGSDSPSQNGATEINNKSLAIQCRVLLYGAGLHAKFWSAALLHAAYLQNRRVHSALKKTPFEALSNRKPNLKHLKMFGSRVCVKESHKRRAKLDMNDFRGIFLGYTATNENIRYIDLDNGRVKTCHHATFDESWYMQPMRPPAPQLLYDLGLEYINDQVEEVVPEEQKTAKYPPIPTLAPAASPLKLIKVRPDGRWGVPLGSKMKHMPLRITDIPKLVTNYRPVTAAAAKVENSPLLDQLGMVNRVRRKNASQDEVIHIESRDRDAVDEFHITDEDLRAVYLSPTPFNRSFEETIDIRKCSMDIHKTAGMRLIERNKSLLLTGMDKSTPGARIPRWRSRMRGAHLLKVNGKDVTTVKEVEEILRSIPKEKQQHCRLLLSHPEITHGISNQGLPIMSEEVFTQLHAEQMNSRWMLPEKEWVLDSKPRYKYVESGDVLNMQTCVMKLTRGKLLQRDDWLDWRDSEHLQLDQYDKQGMFGKPVKVDSNESVFYLVWTYVIKVADGRKKARLTCDGSTRAGQVRILDETYANCVDQTSSRLFYALAAAENKLIFGSDVSNAFAEAAAPKQGFYIRPDKAFQDWWVSKGRPSIPEGYVIPVLSAMQGHPESPRLWEKHADRILRKIGFTPTHHEPCLYTGIINGERVIFKRQVDDFAVACDTEATANHIFDLLDEELSIPIKRQGLLTMFNGVDVLQTKDYIKISSETYLTRVGEKYLDTWMKKGYMTRNRPTPLPSNPDWQRAFNDAKGDPDPKVQAKLAKKEGVKYRSLIGEMIYAMATTRPDVAYPCVKLSQSNTAPSDIHYNGAKSTFRYLYETRNDGIYYWRTKEVDLPRIDPPNLIRSNKQDLLMEGRPEHGATDLHSYADSDWATCPKTRRSFGGACIRLAGGTVGYKCKFQPTVATSSTHAEFMSAHDAARQNLYLRSVMWDLDVPQEAATILYEDNDAATAMGNARKPTTRTRHIDIKYFSICDWIERDLITMERIDTSINLADHLTKILSRGIFHRHMDYIMGHIPPQYSPAYDRIVGQYHHEQDTVKHVPAVYTAPTGAKAAKVFAPTYDELNSDHWKNGNPWADILWHRS